MKKYLAIVTAITLAAFCASSAPSTSDTGFDGYPLRLGPDQVLASDGDYSHLSSPNVHSGPMPGGNDFFVAAMQGDGNFVVYYIQSPTNNPVDPSDRYPKWSSRTGLKGKGPYKLTLHSDGALKLTDSTGALLWEPKYRKPLPRPPNANS